MASFKQRFVTDQYARKRELFNKLQLPSTLNFNTQKIRGFRDNRRGPCIVTDILRFTADEITGKLNCPPIVSQGLQHEKNATNGVSIAIDCRKALMTSTSGVSFLTISGNPKNWFLIRCNDVSFATNIAMLAAAFVSNLSVFAWTKTNPRGKYCPKRRVLFQCISSSFEPVTSNLPPVLRTVTVCPKGSVPTIFTYVYWLPL